MSVSAALYYTIEDILDQHENEMDKTALYLELRRVLHTYARVPLL